MSCVASFFSALSLCNTTLLVCLSVPHPTELSLIADAAHVTYILAYYSYPLLIRVMQFAIMACTWYLNIIFITGTYMAIAR